MVSTMLPGSDLNVESVSTEAGVESPIWVSGSCILVLVAVVEVTGAGLTTVDWLPFRLETRTRMS